MSEFYIGYLPKSPEGIRKIVRLVVGGTLILFVAGALLFAAAQKNFADSAFEFGKITEYQGALVEEPYPSLIVQSQSGATHSGKPYLLVAPGKHGAEQILSGFTGRNVRLRGTLIHREEGQMIEVVPGSIAETKGWLAEHSAPRALGEFTLNGEIVDSKCFLGVMNPGEGKVHRDCAVRCISGGIPPAFVTDDLAETTKILLLTDETGRPLNREFFLDRVAQPIQIRGRVLESKGLLYLQAMPVEIITLR